MNRYWPMLILLAALWGASYLFIKVAVDEVEPAPMMAVRALLAGAILLGYLLVTIGGRRAVAELLGAWRPSVVLGAINAAVPFWLVAWGEKHIDSSVAGIAQSTIPIFMFLLGWRFLPHEPVGPWRIAGVVLGLLGVAVLAGFDPRGGTMALAGTLAVVLASLSYAGAGVYGQLRVAAIPGPVLATGNMLAAGLMLLPFAILQRPDEAPGTAAVASILAMAVLGTALAQLILFRMLRLHGARRLSMVTYLMPVFALAYGVLLLEEPMTAAAVGGLALILSGVALGSGALRPGRREKQAVEESAPA